MKEIKIAVISDTHGLLRKEVIDKIKGSDHIIHAGDIGSPAILNSLKKIAPVKAVKGNIDNNLILPVNDTLTLNSHKIFIIHDISEIKFNPAEKNISAVIFGHSHKSKIENKNGVLYFNPGSIGPRRFNLPVSFGFIRIIDGELKPEIIEFAG